jgi:hypothetical protein
MLEGGWVFFTTTTLQTAIKYVWRATPSPPPPKKLKMNYTNEYTVVLNPKKSQCFTLRLLALVNGGISYVKYTYFMKIANMYNLFLP